MGRPFTCPSKAKCSKEGGVSVGKIRGLLSEEPALGVDSTPLRQEKGVPGCSVG